MSLDDQGIEELAGAHGVDAEALRALLAGLRDRTGADEFYVFWTSGAATGRAGPRRRTLLTFLTPDAALAFAQRNELDIAARPRLRRLALLQLIHAVLREPAIVAILFVADRDPLPPAGRLPSGLRIERADLLRSLHKTSTDLMDTSQM